MGHRSERKENKSAVYLTKVMFLVPRLTPLRRVPSRYRSLLPLGLMLRYQCIVVGKSRRVLTVAIADQGSVCIFPYIGHLTGCQVFAVTIDARHMHLILRRLEQAEREEQPKHRCRQQVLSQAGPMVPPLQTMIQFLTFPDQKLYH